MAEPSITDANQEIQVLSRVGVAIQSLNTIEDRERRLNRGERDTINLRSILVLFLRQQSGNAAIGVLKDAITSKPYPTCSIATRDIVYDNENLLETVRMRCSQSYANHRIEQHLKAEDNLLRGFPQHVRIIERLFRAYHSFWSTGQQQADQSALGKLLHNYAMLTTFEKFEHRLCFGFYESAFISFLAGDLPKFPFTNRFPLDVTPQAWENIQSDLMDAVEEVQDDLRRVNQQESDRAQDLASKAEYAKISISNHTITPVVLHVVHILISTHVSLLHSSTTYLRQCIDTRTPPDWEAENITPFPRAIRKLETLFYGDISMLIFRYFRYIDAFNDKGTGITQLPKINGFVYENTSFVEPTEHPEVHFFDMIEQSKLQKMKTERWGSALEHWIQWLTELSTIADSMLCWRRSHYFLRNYPTIGTINMDEKEDTDTVMAETKDDSSSGAWRPVLTNILGTADFAGGVLGSIETIAKHDKDFARVVHGEERAATPLEAELAVRFAQVTSSFPAGAPLGSPLLRLTTRANVRAQNSSIARQPYPSTLQPRITAVDRAPLVTSLILDAIVQEAWPTWREEGGEERESVRRSFGGAACALMVPTALPEGCSLVVAHRVVKELRYDIAVRLRDMAQDLASRANELR